MDISGFNGRDYGAAVIALAVWLIAMLLLRFTLDNIAAGLAGGSLIGLLNARWMSRWYWPDDVPSDHDETKA